MRVRPEEGLEVIATGRVTTFPGKSSYQIVVESLEPAGVGALMALLEKRRQALTAEGLFDPARKRPLPFFPFVVGVVTSPTGAVIRDILHRLAARHPCRVIVWPARVQGETSAAEVAAGITGFNALAVDGRIPRPDVLIVARGGGSLEDLWSFNEEIVVRAAAASLVPLVSAVGHETDWTLLDLAADLRAPTPTGAAEMVAPVRAELIATLLDMSCRGRGAAHRRLERLRADLRGAARGLPLPVQLVEPRRQRLDHAASGLAHGLARTLRRDEGRLAAAAAALARHAPAARMARAGAKLEAGGRALRLAFAVAARSRASALERAAGRLRARPTLERLGRGRARLDELAGRLRVTQAREVGRSGRIAARVGGAFDAARCRDEERRRGALAVLTLRLASVSVESVLQRGFAVVRDADDGLVESAAGARRAARLVIRFADGLVAAKVEPTGRGGGSRAGEGSSAVKQGSLF